VERYFVEPYRFIPPFKGTLWCKLGKGLVLRHMKRKLGVTRWHITGTEHLRESIAQKAGILLTPNHSRWADPTVVGLLSLEAKQYFYYVASYHLFRQSRFTGWFFNRLGGYSIWREGSDRESLKTTAALLANAERPVVLFPEGTWFRQNDRVNQLQDGLSLITRQAARQSTRPIVIHPVGIKYWMLHDPMPIMHKRLITLERRIGWSPQVDVPIVTRIERLAGAMLALKELELFGEARNGDLDTRIAKMSQWHIERLERQHLGKSYEGWPLERIRRLRQSLTRQLHEKAKDAPASRLVKKDLDDLLFVENLIAHSMEYLRADPSVERLGETIQRIEETVTDEVEVPLVPMGATVEVGPVIDAREYATNDRKNGDALIAHLRAAMQGLLDHLLEQGPPIAWGCPPRAARPRPTVVTIDSQSIKPLAVPPGQLIT
jgi:1-acyl-sn-glycerol-3-phosphate acyltransferase